jgi:uncharacterized protein (TIGR03435 family)
MAFGQVKAPQPAFEVANVKLNKSGASRPVFNFTKSGQVLIANITIGELLPLAFQRNENQIAEIPAWFRSDRYDIAAKTSPGLTEPTLGLMMQSLLASEFKLTFHEEQRPMTALGLVVVKGGPKFQETPGPGQPGCKRGLASVDCESVRMAGLISILTFLAKDYIDRPVIDRTGLTGTYTLKLEWVPRRVADEEGGLTVFEALTKQAGLRLEQQELPVPVIVIDHAERLTEN